MESGVQCPYCGEWVEISVDSGGGDDQAYVEDCPVCCRPWSVHVSSDREGEVQVVLQRQDE